jgi:hypothetical protein
VRIIMFITSFLNGIMDICFCGGMWFVGRIGVRGRFGGRSLMLVFDFGGDC